jgi:hypothetical protein
MIFGAFAMVLPLHDWGKNIYEVLEPTVQRLFWEFIQEVSDDDSDEGLSPTDGRQKCFVRHAPGSAFLEANADGPVRAEPIVRVRDFLVVLGRVGDEVPDCRAYDGGIRSVRGRCEPLKSFKGCSVQYDANKFTGSSILQSSQEFPVWTKVLEQSRHR